MSDDANDIEACLAKAAELGDPHAQYQYAVFLYGWPVGTPEHDQSWQWFVKAARGGDVDAVSFGKSDSGYELSSRLQKPIIANIPNLKLLAMDIIIQKQIYGRELMKPVGDTAMNGQSRGYDYLKGVWVAQSIVSALPYDSSDRRTLVEHLEKAIAYYRADDDEDPNGFVLAAIGEIERELLALVPNQQHLPGDKQNKGEPSFRMREDGGD